MGGFIKFLGLILLFCSCTAAGFWKAAALRRRVKTLDAVDTALSELSRRVASDGRERQFLLAETITKRGLSAENPFLSADDRKMLAEFLLSFGSGDAETEQHRIALCRGNLHEQRNAAKRAADERARLYRVTGFCMGAAGCIFWL